MKKTLMVTLASLSGAALIAGCSSSGGDGGPSTPPANSSAGSSAPSTPPGSGGGTSGTNLSPDEGRQLLADVTAATKAAQRFHLAGTATDAGKQVQFDIHFAPKQVAGSITQPEGKVAIISPGGATFYIKESDALLKQQGGDAAVAAVHGRWLKAPTNDPDFKDVAGSFDKDQFLGEFLSGLDTEGTVLLTKVGPTTVSGVAAVEYYEPSDKGRIFVAASGPPVLLKLDAGADTTLTLSDYDKPYSFAPPPAAQTVDVEQLKSGH